MKTSSINTVALAKAVTTAQYNAARDEVEPGTFQIDMTVHVSGEVRIGEDHETLQANQVPWQALACCLADKVSPAVLKAAMREVQSGEFDIDEAKARTQSVIGGMLAATTRIVRGKVTTSLAATAVAASRALKRA